LFGIFLGDRILLLPVCSEQMSFLLSPQAPKASTWTPLMRFPRETKQKTLEEVAAAFGDRVIAADDNAKRASGVGEAQHVESARAAEP
jgi:hypothetical protein